MGPPKGSRKGKKAWRKNIDASEVDAHIEAASHQERQGLAASSLQDNQLFFVDKSAAEHEAEAAALGLNKSGRRRRAEAKPLRSHLIIQAAHLAKPVLPARRPKSAQGKADALKAVGKPLKAQGVKAAAGGQQQVVAKAAPLEFKLVVNKKQPAPLMDVWGAGGDLIEEALTAGPRGGLPAARKQPKRTRPAPISAVEVDAAGCSYNPEFNQHQDALAELVAQEMKRVIRKQLAPTAPPPGATATAGTGDELDRLQVDADEDDAADGGGDDAAAGAAGKSVEARKKTVKDRNRQKRRRESERALEAQRLLKQQRRELDALPQVEAALGEVLAAQEQRRTRRQVVKAELAASLPPKLGKARYEPAATQVLTSDEVTGSLRELRPCAMVAAERFNSLQKRGLIETRRRQGDRTPRALLEFERGARPERAAEMQREIEAMQKGRRMASRKKDRLGVPDM